MPNDAIQTDVSTPAEQQQTPAPEQKPAPEQNEGQEPRLSRAEMMARLAESRKESLKADGYDPDAPATEEPDDPHAIDAAASFHDQPNTVDQVAKQQAEETILSDDQLANLRVRVKVNGVESIVPLDQLRATAQKTDSADRYLAEAKQLLNEVKAVGRNQQQAAPATDEAPAEPTGNTSQEGDPIDAFTDALFQGDEARAKELLRRAVGGPANAAQIARQVEQQIVIRSALRQFAQDHRDITADPTLSRIADNFLYQETGGKPLEDIPTEKVGEVLEAAGRRTKEWLRSVSGIGPSATGTATTRNERLSRKASIDNLPSASARAVTSEAPPRTAQSVIESMKRARGQV